MTSQPRVLLSGASGFVGRQLTKSLAQSGWAVHAVCRNPDKAVAGVVWHEVDLLEPGGAAAVATRVGANALLHMAWNATPQKYWTAEDNIRWLTSSIELYRAFVEAGGKRAVFAGTCAEYDWSYDTLDERLTPLNPSTLYGAAKTALYHTTRAMGQLDNVGVAWGRIFFLYGPYEHPGRLVPSVIRSLIRGEPALCGDGLARRDFMHVADVAGAFQAILESDYCGPVNVASGRCLPISEVVMEIARQMGRADLLRLGARPPVSEPPALAANSAILHRRIGFQPSFSLTEGIEQAIDWWRTRMTPSELCASSGLESSA